MSSIAGGWRANCTKRPPRRSRPSSSGCADSTGTSDPAAAHELIAELQHLTRRTLEDVRRLAVEVRPRTLDEFGLAAALERLIETWRVRTGIDAHLTSDLGTTPVTGDVATTLYRIVYDALMNVVKHALARHVTIHLTRENKDVIAVIEDDGKGFDPKRVDDGLQTMRERAALVGGRLRIESASPHGTKLVVEVPDP